MFSERDSISWLFAGDLEDDDAIVELLYILRTSRVGDKWSGHVAFPGGKREAEDRDDRAAAARETEEDLGGSTDGLLPKPGEGCRLLGFTGERHQHITNFLHSC